MSKQAEAEFLVKNSPTVLNTFLLARGGRVVPNAPRAHAQAIQAAAQRLRPQRVIGDKDALIVATAQRDGLPLIHRDFRLGRNLRALGIPEEELP